MEGVGAGGECVRRDYHLGWPSAVGCVGGGHLGFTAGSRWTMCGVSGELSGVRWTLLCTVCGACAS